MELPNVQVVRGVTDPLTTSWVAGDGTGFENDVQIAGANQIVLFLTITKGSLDSVELRVELMLPGGDASLDRFQELSSSAGAGVSTLRPLEYQIKASVLDATHRTYLPIPVVGDRMRVFAKGTGTVTGSQLKISAAVARV